MPNHSEERKNDVLTLIKQGVAESDFQRLIDEGAHRHVLLGLLTNLRHYSPGWDCFEFLTGSTLSRKQIKDTLKTIRRTAELIGSLTELIYIAPTTLDVEEDLLSLPENMFFFCNHIERQLRKLDLRRAPTWNHMLAMLVYFVKHTTGKFRDKEVSALVSAVTGLTYDTTALKQWRSRNKRLLRGTQEYPRPQPRKK